MPDINILLRTWQKQDAPQLAAIANNKNIWNNLRDIIPYPYTHADAQAWINYCQKQKPVRHFAVICNGEVAGSIGFELNTDVYRQSVEIGYFIGETYHGKGIATQAVAILVRHIVEHLQVNRIYANIFAHNAASMRVLQKNGFYLESIRRKAVLKNGIITDDYVWVKLV